MTRASFNDTASLRLGWASEADLSSASIGLRLRLVRAASEVVVVFVILCPFEL
jgi:hypothetical protein